MHENEQAELIAMLSALVTRVEMLERSDLEMRSDVAVALGQLREVILSHERDIGKILAFLSDTRQTVDRILKTINRGGAKKRSEQHSSDDVLALARTHAEAARTGAQVSLERWKAAGKWARSIVVVGPGFWFVVEKLVHLFGK